MLVTKKLGDGDHNKNENVSHATYHQHASACFLLFGIDKCWTFVVFGGCFDVYLCLVFVQDESKKCVNGAGTLVGEKFFRRGGTISKLITETKNKADPFKERFCQ